MENESPRDDAVIEEIDKNETEIRKSESESGIFLTKNAFNRLHDEAKNNLPLRAEPNPETLAKSISEPIDNIKLEMEREAIAQRCIAFSRKQAGVLTDANIYDSYVAKNIIRILAWHFDACKAPGSELADLSFEKIRKVGEI